MDLARQYPEAFRRVAERAWHDAAFKARLRRSSRLGICCRLPE